MHIYMQPLTLHWCVFLSRTTAMAQATLLLVVLACVPLFAAASVASPSLRGVNPELRGFYSGEGGKFKCIDGSKTISFDRINDDYCDCPDGSDEPGGDTARSRGMLENNMISTTARSSS